MRCAEFQDQLEELFAPVGGVSFRRMFGGIGIFKETLMFALVADDVLYLKANDATKAAYRRRKAAGRGSTTGNEGQRSRCPTGSVPERLYDEPDEFARMGADRVRRGANSERRTRQPKKAAGKKAAPTRRLQKAPRRNPGQAEKENGAEAPLIVPKYRRPLFRVASAA